MEKLLYEMKPFFCLAMSFAALKGEPVLVFGKIAAIVLFLAAILILFMRGNHRGYF